MSTGHDVVVVLDAELAEELCAQPGEGGVGLRAARAEVDPRVVAYDAAVEHDDAVGQHDRLVHVVGHEQHCGLVHLAEVAQQRVHADPGERVEGAERLVGQQQLRVADQRAGQGGALLLTAGQLVRPRPLASGEADLGERLRASLGGVVGPQAQHDVVEQPLPRQEPRVLEDHRDALGHLDPAVADHSPVQPGQGAEHGALARPAATQQGHELAGRDLEVEAVEHATRLVEAAVQVLDPDRWGQLASVRRHDSAFLSMRRTTPSAVTPRSA